jgi:hypothetical protein
MRRAAREEVVRVPKSFTLMNRTWRVKRAKLNKRTLGKTHNDVCVIELDSKLRGDLLDHTLMHEYLHAACNAIGYAKLDGNEAVIDALAGALVQILRSAK